MRKNNRAARAARTKHHSQPQKEKHLSNSTKALKKVLEILQSQFVLEKTSRRQDICLQTLNSHFICHPPNIRTLVGTLQEQIAMGDVTDITGIFPSSEYRRVYFSRGNTFRSRLFLRQILTFLLPRHVAIHFFIFAIIVARSNQMEQDYLLGAGYTLCFVITSFFLKVSIHGIIAP